VGVLSIPKFIGGYAEVYSAYLVTPPLIIERRTLTVSHCIVLLYCIGMMMTSEKYRVVVCCNNCFVTDYVKCSVQWFDTFDQCYVNIRKKFLSLRN